MTSRTLSDLSPEDAESAVAALRDPRLSLPEYGHVFDQEGGGDQRYDPERITFAMQRDILEYMANPPVDENGRTRWLAVLKARQTGASTTAEIAAYPLVAYTPGFDHVTLADTTARAEYLHGRVQYLHSRWPAEIRVKAEHGNRETRQLTFAREMGGRMRTLSMQQASVGIGQSPNSLHLSESGFAEGMYGKGGQWTMLVPSMMNQMSVRVLNECTPVPLSHPGAEGWREFCYDGKIGLGRLMYAFYPMMDGKLNRRPWGPGWALDLEEQRLLEQYGSEEPGRPRPLTLENLAFRREVLDTDRELKRNPELFAVWYPFDDVSCWVASGTGIIRRDLLEPLLPGATAQWPKGTTYREYREPVLGAQYVIGADPAGYGARDHASFQVFEVWADRWEQVACFACVTEPETFARELMRAGLRYNKALVVIEANGPGVAALSLLRDKGYPELYHEAPGRPGKSSTRQQHAMSETLSWLIDALVDRRLVLRDRDTVDQMSSYRNDSAVQGSEKGELLTGKVARGRRGRGHWDKVSALIMAVVGARAMPTRHRPRDQQAVPSNVVALPGVMTFATESAYSKKREDADRPDPRKGRTLYRSVRRKK